MTDLKEKPLPALLIREMQPNDRGFIAHSYLNTAQHCFAWRNMPGPAFRAFGSRLLDQLLARAQVLVMCAKDEPDKLFAFSIAERPFKDIEQIVLHFIFVRRSYHQRGLCGSLMRTLGYDANRRTPIFATHDNPAWYLLGSKYRSIYNPFFLWPEFQTDPKERAA